MDKLEFTPLTELTVEDVKKLIIHATRSSIRRAAAVKPMTCVPGTDSIPTLYYIQEMNPATKEVTYSIHALSVDVTKYLLLKGIAPVESEGSEDQDTEVTE